MAAAATSYTIGINYGTNSVRAVVVGCADGRVAGTHVFDYPSGDHGVLLRPADPHLARQNPADCQEGLRPSVTGALAAADGQPRCDATARHRPLGQRAHMTGIIDIRALEPR